MLEDLFVAIDLRVTEVWKNNRVHGPVGFDSVEIFYECGDFTHVSIGRVRHA